MKVTFLERIPAAGGIRSYITNQKPLVPSPLIKLPLGAVQPAGWLRHQLDLMEDGLTGRLHETGLFLTESNGWLHPETMLADMRRENATYAPGEDFLRVEEKAFYNEIAWEEQVYWLRGAWPLAVLTGSPRLQAVIRRYADAILSSVQPDGWFGPVCLRNPEEKGIPDIWPHMVAMDFLRDYYECTGDERILHLMEGFFRFLAGLESGKLLPDANNKFFDRWQMMIQSVRAGDIIPHIYWLYNRSKDKALLTLAKRIYEEYRPLSEEGFCTMHGVHFSQVFPYPAFYYELTGKPEDLALAHRWYDDFIESFGQLPGGALAADECARVGKTDPRQGFETCSMTELNRSYLLLSHVEGDPIYGDRSEAVMLNSFPASYTPDMKRVHYITPANLPEIDELDRDYYNRVSQLEYLDGERYRCCVYNSGMGWPTYAQHLLMAADGDGVAAWLYAACKAEVLVGSGVKAHIKEETDYPFDTAVKFEIACEEKVSFPFYLRIPQWCSAFTLKVDGVGVPVEKTGSVLCIEQEWLNNTVEIVFGQEIRIRRWALNGNCASISRGPLDYSLEIGEKWSTRACEKWVRNEIGGDIAYQIHPQTPWNYALDVSSAGEIRVLEMRGVKPQPWNNPDAPIVLGVRGRRLEQWKITDNMIDPVPQSPVSSDSEPEELRLIPMGCARLRLCCFPVVKQETDSE